MDGLIREDTVTIATWNEVRGETVMNKAMFSAQAIGVSLPRAGSLGIWAWVILGVLVFGAAMGGALYLGRPARAGKHSG